MTLGALVPNSLTQISKISRRPKARRFRFYLLSADPISDLIWSLILIPFWWILGIEQFVWSLLLGWTSFKIIAKQRGRIRGNRTLGLLLLFVAVHLLSGFFIVESYRIITFLRNINMYVSIFLLNFIVYNCVESWRQIEKLLRALLLVMALAVLVGLFGIIDLWRPSFTSGIGFVLPEFIKSTAYGSKIAFRTTGELSWFIILGPYFRVTSLFMYATLYATAIAVTIPIFIFTISFTRKYSYRVVLVCVLFGLILNLIFTTGRVASVSLLVGAFYFWLLGADKFKDRRRQIMFGMLMILVATGLLLMVLVGSIPSIRIDELINSFLYARGSGSFESRIEVYISTFLEYLKRPILGWGTERDIPGFPYPMGSHSYYLGILFKQGVFGLIILLLIFWSVWFETKPLAKKDLINTRQYIMMNRFLQYGRWMIIVTLINSTSDVLDLDGLTFIIIWYIFALLIATRRLLIRDFYALAATPPASISFETEILERKYGTAYPVGRRG